VDFGIGSVRHRGRILTELSFVFGVVLAKEMGITRLLVKSDSALVAG